MADKTPFEIGLVLSGTVSAGAYTAGVMDFLIEALDAWYKNKSENVKDTPTHDVLIRVLAGTSGGALTAAVASAALYSKYMPRHDGERPDGKNNRLYTSWVRDIDIEPLLETDDLANNQPLLSALNCKIIDQISERIAYVIPDARRAYVAESLDIYLTFTNLDGVPYNIDLGNGTHYMREHADYRHFILSTNDPYTDRTQLTDDQPIWLEPKDIGSVRLSQSWQDLRMAALASSALPAGLKSRQIVRSLDDYNKRLYAIPADTPCQKAAGEGGGEIGCVTYSPIPPTFSEEELPGSQYKFQAVDGGMANNDPLEFARLGLTREPEGRNIRFANLATKAVIMVAALNSKPTPIKYGPTLMEAVKAMLPTFLDHGRFKLSELKLAASKDVYTRFMIAPTEKREPDTYYKNPIYGAVLQAFGAFLHEELRKHDYMLGRRNCQRFLAEHFDLPETNPLCAGYLALPEAERKKYQTNHGLPKEYKNDQGVTESKVFYSIIPLVDSVRDALPKPTRVTNALVLVMKRDLKSMIHKRLNALIDCIKNEAQKMPDDFWKGLGLRAFLLVFTPFALVLKNIIVDWMIDEIKRQFNPAKLDETQTKPGKPGDGGPPVQMDSAKV